jgi:hypothetical protein
MITLKTIFSTLKNDFIFDNVAFVVSREDSGGYKSQHAFLQQPLHSIIVTVIL